MKHSEDSLHGVREYATQCIREEANATLALIDQLDENFDKAVELMYHCKGKSLSLVLAKVAISVQKSLLPYHLQEHQPSLSIRLMSIMETLES